MSSNESTETPDRPTAHGGSASGLVVIAGMLTGAGALTAVSFRPDVFGPDIGRVLGPGAALRVLLAILVVLLVADAGFSYRRWRIARRAANAERAGGMREFALVVVWCAACLICLIVARDVTFVGAVAVFALTWCLWFGERNPAALAAVAATSVALGWVLIEMTHAPITRLLF